MAYTLHIETLDGTVEPTFTEPFFSKRLAIETARLAAAGTNPGTARIIVQDAAEMSVAAFPCAAPILTT
ncbi:hypothetical protein HLH33_10110 [Gluconacetobacter diazotrophicus]|uniref:Uncharacterized protein n=1 Tax=Gluconacetobacter diazotrophicus TaxID=33996 RepID=A0A7W4FFL3_GLUDI|nr:hypothetical protein [Gluconacetobacter diazotrophicus]MBB2156659.1 hypothetical protein [Gluconacetobacter diazotrophicus]